LEYEDRARTLKKDLSEFFVAVDPNWSDLPGDRVKELLALRERFEPRLKQAVAESEAALTSAHETLRGPQAELARRLRDWLEHVRQDETTNTIEKDWPRILRAWRQAIHATSREAAQLLDVSPSAIVRYERGTRSPSRPYVEAMIHRISSSDGVMPVSDERRAATEYVRTFGLGRSYATEFLERLDRERIEIECQGDTERVLFAEIQRDLEGLTPQELRVVAALINRREALQALLTWAADYDKDPLRPVLQAFADAGLPSHMVD
ncbi:MAG: helix-turn-helix domain-containing protein, partial [Actinomycetota bacterium]|nr:helix-turn-helix domain-containing protein [Actinomycetota bacterium]